MKDGSKNSADEESSKQQGEDAKPVSRMDHIKSGIFNGLACAFTLISPEVPPLQNGSENYSVQNQLFIGISGQVVLVWLLLAWSEKAGCLIGISPLVIGATVSASACADCLSQAARSMQPAA